MEKQLLTHSRKHSFQVCRRRSWWEYEQGIRRVTDSRALRMGSAYHAGLHTLKQGCDLDLAIDTARAYYGEAPPQVEEYTWKIEQETIAALLSGYEWRWADREIEFIESEQPFYLPLINPETNAASRNFMLAGKIDGIAKIDGRLVVLEHKLYSEDLNENSDFWRRLQLDHQLTIYLYAARHLGYDVSAVFFDVTRKPTIRPERVPLQDKDGIKIVLDADGQRVMTKDGKKPRQTPDKAKGWILQTRPMTPEEWSRKLINDIGLRPAFYYACREIPRLDDDINECMSELWEVQKTLREAQRQDRWYRTVSRDTCPFCPYFALCSSHINVIDELPEEFQILDNIHPELEQ